MAPPPGYATGAKYTQVMLFWQSLCKWRTIRELLTLLILLYRNLNRSSSIVCHSVKLLFVNEMFDSLIEKQSTVRMHVKEILEAYVYAVFHEMTLASPNFFSACIRFRVQKTTHSDWLIYYSQVLPFRYPKQSVFEMANQKILPMEFILHVWKNKTMSYHFLYSNISLIPREFSWGKNWITFVWKQAMTKAHVRSFVSRFCTTQDMQYGSISCSFWLTFLSVLTFTTMLW